MASHTNREIINADESLSNSQLSWLKDLSREQDETKEKMMLDFADFSDKSGKPNPGFKKEEIEEDIRKTRAREISWAQTNSSQEKEFKSYANLLEIVFTEVANGWLPGVFSASSKYDDYFNGVDIFLEMNDGQNEETLKIALDLTFSMKKFIEKLTDIKNRPVAKVKYFKSEMTEEVGPTEMPRIALWIDRKTLIRIAKKYFNYLQGIKDRTSRVNNAELINSDPGRLEILEELITEIDAIAALADNRLKQKLEKTLGILKEFQKEKPRLEPKEAERIRMTINSVLIPQTLAS